MMGSRGQFGLMILVFLIIMLLPIVLSWVFPIFDVLIKFYLALVVFMFVRAILGAGVLTYVVAGILIYIFVIKLFALFAAGYMLYLIASLMLSGIIIFGLQKHG